MRRTLILLFSFLISGCDWATHPVDAKFSTYLNRIANVQDAEPLPLNTNTNILLPTKRDLNFDIPLVTIGLLDSYELRKCELFNLIAEKNSVLGKVQDQFRNFDYQVQLIYGIDRCLLNEALSPALKAQLTQLASTKRNQLPMHFSNLVYTSDAMRSQLTAYEWINADNASISSTLLQAINQIDAAWHTTSEVTFTNTLNSVVPYQEVLEKEPAIGELSYSMLNASIKLNTITQQLKTYDERIICGQSRDTTKFKYLRNVFQQLFIEDIQAYLAKLDSVYLRIEPMIGFTQSAHPNFRYPIQAYHAQFRQSISAHVDYWKSLFARCGALPSR
ncbi:DUF3080 domain-containing protein [Vibrio japonicus]|uniref:DUF3080 domain-containing protein n=1 Tax=Vibrio japonicus TaxID=1824638 RepID=A0ABY5LLF2_9VIBR|nr:DUF3080 domain-containing protein [Vibrio japonicus]UUM31731.1 DUF3080 domain-containing protein [Vibrio japonicus]